MKTSAYLEQPGLVVTSSDGQKKILIQGTGGCSACHSSLCMLGESQAKFLDLPVSLSSLTAGDPVHVRINRSSGYTGVLWLYVIPFFLMMFALTGTLYAGYSEGWAGLASIFMLVPYFMLIYLFRKRLAAHCQLTISTP